MFFKRTLLATALLRVTGDLFPLWLCRQQIYGNGGTIAGAGRQPLALIQAGKVSVNHLVAAVPLWRMLPM